MTCSHCTTLLRTSVSDKVIFVVSLSGMFTSMCSSPVTNKTWCWSDLFSTKWNALSFQALWILIRQHDSKSIAASGWRWVAQQSANSCGPAASLNVRPHHFTSAALPPPPPPSTAQPVLHSCCSNPLRLLPALNTPFSPPHPLPPPSIVCISLTHEFSSPRPFLCHHSVSSAPFCLHGISPFSSSRAELLKHCVALPTRPCVHALC